MTSNKVMQKKEDRQYFEEARKWDEDSTLRERKVTKWAWRAFGVISIVAALEAVALFSVFPLKTVEWVVVRVDNSTGMVDVISTLNKTDGVTKDSVQEVTDKFFITKYIRHREGYLWATRDYDRKMTGLMSSSAVQQEYASYTDPRANSSAPVAMYGKSATVESKVKSISFINREKTKSGEEVTALVRYTKTIKRTGDRDKTRHWAATLTFRYVSAEMPVEDRLENPLGFQVIGFKPDQESAGGQ